jgi:glutathione S-transferase
MRLYSYIGSGNAYKVELLLALLGARYERVEVSIFEGKSRTPAFLRKNPAGRVPVLELADGTCLPESNAILWHLARGTPFAPVALAQQDRALAWLLFEQSEIEPVIGTARFWILTGRDGERHDELARRRAWGEQSLIVLERELAHRRFLLGDRVSLADIALYAFTHVAPDVGLALGPHVTAWCQRIEALPRYVAGPGPYDPHALAPMTYAKLAAAAGAIRRKVAAKKRSTHRSTHRQLGPR